MESDNRNEQTVGVDELWIRELAEATLAALERYLTNQAAFAEYLRERGDL